MFNYIEHQCCCVILINYNLSSFLSESPRWLYVKGQPEEGERIVRKMAEVNKKLLPDNLDIVIKVPVSFWHILNHKMYLENVFLKIVAFACCKDV